MIWYLYVFSSSLINVKNKLRKKIFYQILLLILLVVKYSVKYSNVAANKICFQYVSNIMLFNNKLIHIKRFDYKYR